MPSPQNRRPKNEHPSSVPTPRSSFPSSPRHLLRPGPFSVDRTVHMALQHSAKLVRPWQKYIPKIFSQHPSPEAPSAQKMRKRHHFGFFLLRRRFVAIIFGSILLSLLF